MGNRLLGILLRDADREAILGDFAEEYQTILKRSGTRKARSWYWLEILRSALPLLYLAFGKIAVGRIIEKMLLQNDNRLAGAGLLFSLPALLLCIGGIMQSFFGLTHFNQALNFDWFFFHPAILLGGLVLSIGLNLIPVFRLRFVEGNLIGTLVIRSKLVNLGVVLLTIIFLTIIFLYVLAENFQVFAR